MKFRVVLVSLVIMIFWSVSYKCPFKVINTEYYLSHIAKCMLIMGIVLCN